MYEVGDKVRVIGAQNNIRRMKELIGSICTISAGFDGCYELKEDHNSFGWLPEWLEPYEESSFEIQEDNILELLGE